MSEKEKIVTVQPRKKPEGYDYVSGGTLSLRFKRSGTKLDNTSLSTGVFKGPPDT